MSYLNLPAYCLLYMLPNFNCVFTLHFHLAQILTERLDGLRVNWAQVRELTKSNRDQLEQWLADKMASEASANSSGADVRQGSSVDIHTPQSTSLPDIKSVQLVESKGPLLDGAEVNTAGVHGKQGFRSSVGNEPPVLRVNLNELEQWMSESKEKLEQFKVISTNTELKCLEQTINVSLLLSSDVREHVEIVCIDGNHLGSLVSGGMLSLNRLLDLTLFITSEYGENAIAYCSEAYITTGKYVLESWRNWNCWVLVKRVQPPLFSSFCCCLSHFARTETVTHQDAQKHSTHNIVSITHASTPESLHTHVHSARRVGPMRCGLAVR